MTGMRCCRFTRACAEQSILDTFNSFRYTDALRLQPEVSYKLYSNRSLAYAKANRFDAALADAQTVIKLHPTWSKGYWRLGMAQLGVKQHLHAIASFTRCWRLDNSKITTLQSHTGRTSAM